MFSSLIRNVYNRSSDKRRLFDYKFQVAIDLLFDEKHITKKLLEINL